MKRLMIMALAILSGVTVLSAEAKTLRYAIGHPPVLSSWMWPNNMRNPSVNCPTVI